MTESEATALVEWLAAPGGGALRPRGIHLHVGSQLGAVDAWRDAVRRGLAVVALLVARFDRRFDTLDVGGGFPVFPPASRRPRRSGSRARSRRSSTPLPRTAGRRASPSNPAGSWSRARAGSSPACCTCASAADARSSSMPG